MNALPNNNNWLQHMVITQQYVELRIDLNIRKKILVTNLLANHRLQSNSLSNYVLIYALLRNYRMLHVLYIPTSCTQERIPTHM